MASAAPRTDGAINNLRAVVVLFVIAVHSVLGYAASAPHAPIPFDRPPYNWRTFPVLDPSRFIGFDVFCAWADVFLMPLFFLVSGFFVWQSLERNGAHRFVRRRAARLVPPFLVGVGLLLPIAVYPAYARTATHPGLVDYWHRLTALPFWPAGPMWFLWVLLVFDLLAAAGFLLLPEAWVSALSDRAARAPKRFFAGFLALSMLAYVPLGTAFGPMRWFQFGPFSFQLNCIGLEAFYFFGGVVVGARGYERALPMLARRWKRWSAAAAVMFGVWLAVSAKTFTTPGPSLFWQFADAVALVPACFASCCAALGLATRFAGVRGRVLDSLRACAFGMYWVHYPIVAWLQYAGLRIAAPAIPKALLVFVCATALSWSATALLLRVPVAGALVGGGLPRRRPPSRSVPTYTPALSD
ncbi:MAG: acyltransferase family protein [Rhizomicrobium sp.]